MMIIKLNGKIDVMKLVDWLGCQSLLICDSTYLFHISGIDEPDKAWEKLESMFGKHNEIRSHQLENELISLNPNDFSCIKDYLSKYKNS